MDDVTKVSTSQSKLDARWIFHFIIYTLLGVKRNNPVQWAYQGISTLIDVTIQTFTSNQGCTICDSLLICLIRQWDVPFVSIQTVWPVSGTTRTFVIWAATYRELPLLAAQKGLKWSFLSMIAPRLFSVPSPFFWKLSRTQTNGLLALIWRMIREWKIPNANWATLLWFFNLFQSHLVTRSSSHDHYTSIDLCVTRIRNMCSCSMYIHIYIHGQ